MHIDNQHTARLMTRSFIYPVDTDQFQLIREQGKVYIDKTEMIFDLVNVRKYQYVFLARPRRFGKSLLCNTFKAYFQGQRELFYGLKINELEKEWKKYPVLYFDMSDLKNYSLPDARSNIERKMRIYENIYGRDPQSVTLSARFSDLIHNASKTTGEKVVVIFDEYDAPIMRLLYSDDLDAMRNMLRGFYQVIKSEGAYLKFVFITGVTVFSQLSIFSELNNLYHISMLDEYSGICGITSEELTTTLRPCVEEYAKNLGITAHDAYAQLKKNYDGYHFSKNGKDVYAPYSLLKALNDNSTNHYWFESGTMTALIEHLRHYPITSALEYDGVQVAENEFNIACEKAETPIPLLYQSGYLTIQSYNARIKAYTLHFPNLEVREGMISGLMPLILNRPTADTNRLVFTMSEALLKGNIGEAIASLRSFIASIPYDIITRQEWNDKNSRESFYKLLFYMTFSMLNSIVDTEVKSILGRADVVITTHSCVFVIELKVDDTVDNALAQIDSMGYAIPYQASGRRVLKCGVSISSKARNITHWRVTDACGALVEERDFGGGE